MDLSKLTPAPWTCPFDGSGAAFDSDENPVADCGGEVDAEFIALARNAFDVMMRRGWGVAQFGDVWAAIEDRDGPIIDCGTNSFWPDPFTALVEADRQTKEYEAKRCSSSST